MGKEKIKILIVDDHPIIRRGLIAVINSDENLEVVGEAENGKIALQKIRDLFPDIVVLDIDMPVLDGFDTAKIINSDYPQLKIVFLSMHKDKEVLKPIAALNMKGYVLKDCAVIEIVDCLLQVARNEIFISPSVMDVLRSFSESSPYELDENSPINFLSPAEIQILKRISESKTNREIADEMFLSIRTVENHRFKICQKLELRGNHALLKFALDNKESIISKFRSS